MVADNTVELPVVKPPLDPGVVATIATATTTSVVAAKDFLTAFLDPALDVDGDDDTGKGPSKRSKTGACPFGCEEVVDPDLGPCVSCGLPAEVVECELGQPEKHYCWLCIDKVLELNPCNSSSSNSQPLSIGIGETSMERQEPQMMPRPEVFASDEDEEA